MIFVYKSPTGYIVSRRTAREVNDLSWEPITAFSTMESALAVADRKYKGYVVDTMERKVPLHFRKIRPPQKDLPDYTTNGKSLQWRINKSRSMQGHTRYNDPWKTYKSRAKFGASRAKAWAKKPETYWAIQPDGKQVRIWLPDGKDTLPEGWRFGRHKFKKTPPAES